MALQSGDTSVSVGWGGDFPAEGQRSRGGPANRWARVQREMDRAVGARPNPEQPECRV